MGQEYHFLQTGTAEAPSDRQISELQRYLRSALGEPDSRGIYSFGNWEAIWCKPGSAGYVRGPGNGQFLLSVAHLAQHGLTLGLTLFIDGDPECGLSEADLINLEIQARSKLGWPAFREKQYLKQAGTPQPLTPWQMEQIALLLSRFRSPLAESRPGISFSYSQGRNQVIFWQHNGDLLITTEDWFDREFVADFIGLIDAVGILGVGLYHLEPSGFVAADWPAMRESLQRHILHT